MQRTVLKILFVSIYTLVFGELFFRIMDPQPLIPRYVTGGPHGIRVNIPEATYKQTTPEVNIQVRTNSKGIRSDREYDIEKPKGVFRIVLLGDSFFMGYEVDLEFSFAWLLEKYLNERGIKTEVINLAVSGYGTAEHLITLENVGLQYSPDVIVMQWHKTDSKDNLRSRLYAVDNNGKLQRTSSDYLPGIKTRDFLMGVPGYPWLIQNCHLYSVVRERAAAAMKDLLVKTNGSDKQVGNVKDKRKQQSFSVLDTLLLQRISDVVADNNAHLILLDVPSRENRMEYTSSLQRVDIESLSGVQIVSPVESLLTNASPENKLYFEQGHGHWTQKGNQIITDYLLNHILDIVR